MSNVINFFLTHAGISIIPKILNGKLLNFTRMAVGDGFSYDETASKNFSSLVNEVLSLDIIKKETLSPSSIKITSAFKNTDAQKEFYYREVGLFAQDPDTGEEILYAYGNRNDAAELITPTSSNVVTKQLTFIVSVGDSAKVTFNVNTDVYALQEDVTTLQTSLHELNRTKASQSDLEVERARITNLATLKEGSTTGDAELIDARVDDLGNTHENIGTAFRKRVGHIANVLNEIQKGDLYSDNLLSYTNAIVGGSYNTTSGAWKDDAEMNVSNFIPVSLNDVFVFSIKRKASIQFALFDANKNCIGGNTTILSQQEVGTVVTYKITNKDAKYVAIQNNLYFNDLILNYVKKVYSLYDIKELNSISTSLNEKSDKVNSQYGFNYIDADDIVLGKIDSNGNIVTSTTDCIKTYSVTQGKTYRIFFYNNIWLSQYAIYNADGIRLDYLHITELATTEYADVVMPEGATTLKISCPLENVDWTYVEEYGVLKVTEMTGKKIVFFGTSIPAGYGAGIDGFTGKRYREGSYPYIMGHYLNAKVYNEAVGSSCVCCRKESLVSTSNPYGFIGNFDAVSRCLTNTVAMMDWVISNYNSGVFTSNKPSNISEQQANYIRSYSYENKLLPYINGTIPVDMYVFEHGHNDSNTDNFTTDTNCSKGMFSYGGCMKFLFDLIYKANPKARIVIMSHYENQLNTEIVKAQEMVATYYSIPFLPLYKYMPWGQRTVVTNGYWNSQAIWVENGGSEQTLTTRQIWIKDNLHPHSDKSGKANHLIAKQASKMLLSVATN